GSNKLAHGGEQFSTNAVHLRFSPPLVRDLDKALGLGKLREPLLWLVRLAIGISEQCETTGRCEICLRGAISGKTIRELCNALLLCPACRNTPAVIDGGSSEKGREVLLARERSQFLGSLQEHR